MTVARTDRVGEFFNAGQLMPHARAEFGGGGVSGCLIGAAQQGMPHRARFGGVDSLSRHQLARLGGKPHLADQCGQGGIRGGIDVLP